VRLIRSKGVGVYFVTQNPLDVPEKVLGQLGNRVQHALRAFTPRDQKAVKSVAQTMRPNPKLDIERAILELGVGEALVSLLDAKGTPGVTERAYVLPPASQIGPIEPAERRGLVNRSLVAGVYEKALDRESAFEMLKARAESAPAPAPGTKGAPGTAAPAPGGGGMLGGISDILFGSTGPRGGRREGVVEAAAKSAARSAGSAVARQVLRGVLGSLLGGKK
jgi:DNA helicase HerA-like ATPase